MPDERRRDPIIERIVSLLGIPPIVLGVGEIDVPCGPGRYCARIEYDERGPVLNTRFKREEFALAMEERLGGPFSDDALMAYNRRVMAILGLTP